jgi:hypothetical protein
MKIALCGSMSVAKDMLDIKQYLEKKKHSVVVPVNIDSYANGKINVEDKWKKIDSDVIRAYFEKIKNVDAILVVNKDKNKIKNYVGGNGLIEMAFAHVLGKKIYLLNEIPEINYSDEIKAMKPVVINGNLDKIKEG